MVEHFKSRCKEWSSSCADDKYIDPLESRLKAYFWSLVMIFVLVILLAISLLFIGIIGLSGEIRDASINQAVFMLVLMVIAISMSAVIIAEVQNISFILAPFLLLLTLVTTGNSSVFSFFAVRALGQGEIRAARIVISGKTCREISQTLGQRVCIYVANEEATAICPVMIRSRIGSQVLLEFAPLTMGANENRLYWALTRGKTGGEKGVKLTHRVVIDKAKLLSWQPLQGFG